MKSKRLGWIVAGLAGMVLAGMWTIERMAAQDRLGPGGAATTRPAATSPSAKPATAAASAPAATSPAAKPASAPAEAPAGPGKWFYYTKGLGKRNKFVLGSVDPKSGYLLQVEFVREGAAVYTAKLAESFATVDDQLLYDRVGKDHERYLAEAAKDPDTYRGHYSLLNPVGEYLPYATRSITVLVEGGKTKQLVRLDRQPWRHVATRTVSKPAPGGEISFETFLVYQAAPSQPMVKALKLTKTYRIFKDDYAIQMSLKVEDLIDKEVRVYFDQLGPTGVPREELHRSEDDRFAAYGREMPDGLVEIVQLTQPSLMKSEGGAYVEPSGKAISLGRADESEPLLWVGQSNKFFASMVYVRPAVKGRLAAAQWQADFHVLPADEIKSSPSIPASRTHVTAVRIGGSRPQAEKFQHAPDLPLKPGQSEEVVFDIFVGPKKRDMFKDSGDPHYRPLYGQLNYFGTITFRSCFCACNALTEKMMQLLKLIATYVTFGNYGVAIIVLVVLVRVVLHPLTKSGQVSMMRMQKQKPEMERLKKKYADDKEALQKEMMKLTKEQLPATLRGCLPMLLQMPIWISLWGSLNAAVGLRHARFLPIWITDLAGPDALIRFGWSFELPLIGGMTGPISSFNLLPLLLVVAMWLQMKFNPSMAQTPATASPEQDAQKKMMQYMMPAMMLLFFYNAASGLTLYIMTSTFAGVFEQQIIRRHIRDREAAEAAIVTTVKVPGKGARSNRPKKPKGPFYTKRG